MNERVDLDGEIRRVDPDRWLASRFIGDAAHRADVIALYALDRELARAALVTTNSLAAEIRLTWWRETVEEIFAGAPTRGHPVAEAIARVVGGRRLPAEPFNEMIGARIDALRNPDLDAAETLRWARGAQGNLARLAALVLGARDMAGRAEPAGIVWGLMLCRRTGRFGADDDVMRHSVAEARVAARDLPPRAFPAALPATLARAGPLPTELEKRARLTWAALTGRL